LRATDAERKAAELKREKLAYADQVALAKGNSDKLIELERQHLQKVADINKDYEQKPDKNSKKEADQKQTFIDALQRESDTYVMTAGQIKIYEAAKKGIVGIEMQQVMALASEIDARDAATKATQDHAKAVADANKIIGDIDPIAKATQEWEKLLALKAQGLLTDEQMGQAYAKTLGGMEDKTDKSTTKMSDTQKNFRDNTQRVFGDQLYDAMTGKFGSIEDAFKQMLFRMAANAAAQRITEGLFGNGKEGSTGLLSPLMKAFGFAKGGAFGGDGVMAFANGGAFTNQVISEPTYFAYGGALGKLGQVGEAGPEAIMPLSRGSDGKLGVRAQGGGGNGVSIVYSPTIQIDSRTDQAQVRQLVDNSVRQGNAQLVDTLQRRGIL